MSLYVMKGYNKDGDAVYYTEKGKFSTKIHEARIFYPGSFSGVAVEYMGNMTEGSYKQPIEIKEL